MKFDGRIGNRKGKIGGGEERSEFVWRQAAVVCLIRFAPIRERGKKCTDAK